MIAQRSLTPPAIISWSSASEAQEGPGQTTVSHREVDERRAEQYRRDASAGCSPPDGPHGGGLCVWFYAWEW